MKIAVTIQCVRSGRGTAKKGEMKSKDKLGEWERENSIYLKQLQLKLQQLQL